MNSIEIRELPPTNYLRWENFVRPSFDRQRDVISRYEEGFRIGKQAGTVFVDSDGAWYVEDSEIERGPYEVIGETFPNGCHFWLGVLESGAAIVVERDGCPHLIK
jgi:hypothetical protein